MTTPPLLTNDRAAREWAWIVAQVGESAALTALGRLGNRRPYPLNVARILRLELPADLADAPAKKPSAGDFAALRQILKNGA